VAGRRGCRATRVHNAPISATGLIWAFFSEHPLGTPASVGGVAEQPDATALPSTTSAASNHGRAYALGGAALVAVAAIGAGAECLPSLTAHDEPIVPHA